MALTKDSSMTDGAPDRPLDLLADYRPGSFLFASPRRTLLAEGAGVTVAGGDPVTLSDGVAKALAEHGTPFAVGALPFDDEAAAHIVLPSTVRWSRSLHPEIASMPRHPLVSGHALRAVPEPEVYQRGVARAVTELTEGRLRKVVLARTLGLDLDEPVDLRKLLHNLARDNSHGFTFAAPLPGDRTLVGATPELLLSRTGTRMISNPLAGSRPRGSGTAEDEAMARELLSSAKDREEHQIVVDSVAESLRPFCRSLDVPGLPSLISTPTMWHLSTTITGELADDNITALTLACALHPTPAVCGTPTATARRAIAELEPFDRGFYTGAVGWCDDSGDGEWVVAIRCAEVAATSLRLFAGAGIVAASEPAEELAETSAKFRTLLRAMGVDP